MRLFTAAAATAAAAVLPGLAAAGTNDVVWTSNSTGTSYAVFPLQRATGQEYVIADSRNAKAQYTFNIFATTAQPTAAPCQARGPLTAMFGWQIEGPPDKPTDCYHVAGNSSIQWDYSLFDPVYPNRGVMITFGGGDATWCGYNNPGRSMTLAISCAPDIGLGYTYQTLDVYEENTCNYRIILPSIMGCPTQCLTGTNLCNGHGVCGYNSDAKRSQCFCFSGWGDGMCGTATKAEGMSVESVLLIIVCLILAGVLSVVGFMFLKLRRLQVDPAAYDELQGRFNELGQLA